MRNHSSFYTSRSTRRDFARLLGAAVALTGTSWAAAASVADVVKVSRMSPTRRLIVLEMQGGNDALNTLIPRTDPLYRRYRPTIAVAQSNMIALDDELALNDALEGLSDLYHSGDVAIIQDVGYPHPNLSHFESAAIWAAGRLEDVRGSGWIARTIAANRSRLERLSLDADGVVLGGNSDLLAGQNVHALAVDDVTSFLNGAPEAALNKLPANAAQAHILDILRDTDTLSQRLRAKLVGENRFRKWFTREHYIDPFSSQIATLLWMLESDCNALVYKLSLPGFDMHTNLRGQHEALLRRLDAGVSGLVRGLQEIGLWRDTLIMASSEFGRRPQENASAGTDHGAPGPVVLMGGRVPGGIHGRRADLAALDQDGNPLATTDFRSVYAAVVAGFWKLDANPLAGAAAPPLQFT